MEKVCIVVANEPCVYRDVLATTLQELRPELDVMEVDPGQLDSTVARVLPQLVVCSELSEVIETRSPAWIVLYPNGESRAELSVDGRRATLTGGINFACVLQLIDEVTGALAQPGARC